VGCFSGAFWYCFVVRFGLAGVFGVSIGVSMGVSGVCCSGFFLGCRFLVRCLMLYTSSVRRGAFRF
jgi:hypothetical protein